MRVTHPFHPLLGRKFELIAYRQTWGEYRVFFYDARGRWVGLPAGWTDAVEPDPVVVQAAGRSHFRAEDLLRLADVLAGLKSVRRRRRTAGQEI